MLTTWSNLDPKNFERGVQMILRRLYPDLVSIDGAGGDGGKDAYLRTPSGLTVFEMKYFPDKLTSTRKRQVERSLSTAVAKSPEMSRWVLITPLNRSTSSGAWFDNKLAGIAPGVELEWWGQDWLDGQLRDHPAFQQAMEGYAEGLLGAAKEFKMEQEILAHGAKDLVGRVDVLRRRADDVSPSWALDFATHGNHTTLTIRPKSPEAPVIDPISLGTTIVFGTGEEGARRRDAFAQDMDFGGSGTVDVAELRVEGSEESRRLLEGMEGPGQISYISPVENLPKPLRCQLQLRNTPDGPLVRSLEVTLRRRTMGNRGITLMGEDATGTVEVTLRLPEPTGADGPVVTEAGFHIALKPMAGVDADLAIGVFEFRDAARPGLYLSPSMKGFKSSGLRLAEQPGGPVDGLLEVARVLDRIGTLLGVAPLALPSQVSDNDLLLARALVDSLEGRPGKTPFTSFKGNITAGSEQAIVDRFSNGPTAIYLEYQDAEFDFDDLHIKAGHIGFHAPSVTLTNRDEVLAATPGDAVAELRTTDGPITIVPRAEMKHYGPQQRD